MKTIKLPYISTESLIDLQRQYTCLVKIAYNRLLDNLNDKDIRQILNNLNNVKDLDSRFTENAILDAKGFQKENKLIFRRLNFVKRFKNKITSEQFKENKYLPLVNYGEKANKGNRKFCLKMEENKVIFKLNRNKHIDLNLPSLKPNLYNELINLQELMELNKLSVSFKIDKNNLFISYEPPIKETIINDLMDKRILGIDLNPNYIGLSILEFNTKQDYRIIYKSYINLTEINQFKTNKKKYEIIMVSKQIVNLMKSFNVGNLAIEELSMKSKNHNKGKRINRLLNGWNRNLLINNLTKRSKIEGIKVFNINPVYTSFIGNLKYDYFDPINAAIEVARRGYQFNKMFIKNTFYSIFKLKDKWNQWKEETCLDLNNWVDVYKHLKTLEMKWRVPLETEVYRQEYRKHILFYV